VLKGGKAMFRQKIFSVITVVLFVFGTAMIDCAMAGEKFTAHGVSFTTSWKQVEVGDEEGHVIAIQEQKQLYIDDKTGQKMVSTSSNLVDINLKTGLGSLKGYGVETYPNGDKAIRTHEGKPAGKDHWKGTWSIIKGTGKLEGLKGRGTWDSYYMGQGQPSYMEVEGEMEMPGQ
jgi:hypothetical protein